MAKKARKWSNLDGEVPEQPVEVSERELAIRAATTARSASTMQQLAAEYGDLCEEEEFEELAKAKRNVVFEALERRIADELKRVIELSGQDTWRGEGQLFTPKTSVIPIVADRAVLMQHLKDTKQEALLTLEYPRLKSLTVAVLEELEALTPAQRATTTATMDAPLPGVKVYLKKGIKRTKS